VKFFTRSDFKKIQIVKLKIDSMKLNEKMILDAVGKIIDNSSISELDCKRLSIELRTSLAELKAYFPDKNAIILFMLRQLHEEIIEIIQVEKDQHQTPTQAFNRMFIGLDYLFEAKSYYLPVIFYAETKNSHEEIRIALDQVKLAAQKALELIIERGKESKDFKIRQASEALVENILSSFRSFVAEKQVDRKIREAFDRLKTNLKN
jgi:AcrR family transcriptional regulator